MRRSLLWCVASVALVALVACEGVVDPPTGDPVDLSFAPCVGAPDNPSWFAYQDGDGAWTRVTPSAAGAFSFTLASGKGGIALYFPPDGVGNDGLVVLYATTEELVASMPACNGSVRSVSGSVTGYVSLDRVKLTIGNSETLVPGSATPPASFVLSAVDATATDLVAVRYRTSFGTAFEAFPSSVVLRRSVTGNTTGTVDFTSTTEAGAPLQRTLSVTNLASTEELRVYSHVALESTVARIAEYVAGPTFTSGAATAPFYGVAGTRLSTGESQAIYVEAAKVVSVSTDETRFATSVFIDPVDRSMTLGPALGPVTINGTSRPSASYTVQAGYDNVFDAVFDQGSGSTARRNEVVATRGYLGTGTSVTLAVPNLSGVSGFSSAWLLSTGASSRWLFSASDATLRLTGAAITYQGAERTSSFTP